MMESLSIFYASPTNAMRNLLGKIVFIYDPSPNRVSVKKMEVRVCFYRSGQALGASEG